MRKLRCIVIDDEPMAGRGLAEYIGEIDALECMAVVHTAAEAIKHLPEADLMYLDINMPVISGIDFLQQISNPPLTIVTTAYQQYALQSFELDVVDYLLKPVSFPRFLKATNKAIDYLRLRDRETTATPANADGFFFIKSNNVLEKIALAEIVAVEALSNYVVIHCAGRKIIAYLTLKQVSEYLPEAFFVQVHRSYIVSIDQIKAIDRESIKAGQLDIPIGSNFRDTVQNRILEGKVLKR
jgi:DNA-binding LytR/AlgR family response regulator